MVVKSTKRGKVILLCVIAFSSISAFFYFRFKSEGFNHYKSRNVLTSSVPDLVECIPSGADSFPDDIFTQDERRRGAVVMHFIILAYICAMTAIICDNYFVPSLEVISDKLKLSPDVAGATFMAMGASAPELFSSIAGSFITEDDIGIGTVVGSAVFNILGITGVVGLFLWNHVLPLEWFPIARDCIVYGFTVLALFFIISDNIVTWWESLSLLLIFILYISIMHFNQKMEKFSEKLENQACFRQVCFDSDERKPLLSAKSKAEKYVDEKEEKKLLEPDFKKGNKNENTEIKVENECSMDAIEESAACSSPKEGGPWRFVWWVLMYPATILFFLTIPPIRKNGLKYCFPVTFLVSVIWMGMLSYLAVWIVTIIAVTLRIPNSVAGLTILAAGASVPDLIATVIVAKNGFGNMAISNLIGSNTFDLSFCLAAPWFVKSLVNKQGYLLVYSSAMTYTTGTLLLTLFSLILAFRIFRWQLNKMIGILCILLYLSFIALACMFELNVFGMINLPTCL